MDSLPKIKVTSTSASPSVSRRRSWLPSSATYAKWFLAGLLALICTFYQTHRIRKPDHRLSKRFAICSTKARIYSSEPTLPRSECVVVEFGTISYLGTQSEVEKRYGSRRVSNLDWRYIFRWSYPSLQMIVLEDTHCVLPGLIDAHAHPLEYGQARMGVDLLGCPSVRCIIDRIVQHIRDRPDLINHRDKMILGDGWDQTLFESKKFPSAADLSSDPLLVGRPIALRRIDFHAYWVSQAILNRLNPSDLDSDIDGGEIMRDGDGNPTGIFMDKAMSLIEEIQPKRTDEDRLEFLKTTSHEMLSLGLTGVHDAAADLETIEFYKKMDQEGKLPVRIWAMINCGDQYCGDRIELYKGTRLAVRSAKLFLDGALGSWGAALWEPYTDNPESKGILRIAPELIFPLTQKWVKSGFQVNAHAIGDRANTLILDAYTKVLAEVEGSSDEPDLYTYQSRNELRLRIEHAQILRPSDIERMGRMNILASVQPTHAVADMSYAEARLGPERIRGAYAWKSLQRNNVTLVLGSDFPVSPVSPFLGIHAAFARKNPVSDDKESKTPNPSWFPEERIATMQEVINGFTRDASYASFAEDSVGSLRKGKLADMIILDQDIMENTSTREEQEDVILRAKVLATILNGDLVYGQI